MTLKVESQISHLEEVVVWISGKEEEKHVSTKNHGIRFMKKGGHGNSPRRANNSHPGEDSRSGSRSQGGPSTGKELAKQKGDKLYTVRTRNVYWHLVC